MSEYEFHPAANLFPMLGEDRLNELAEDIAENGQRESIQVFAGKILDGRNRYRACLKAGIEPKFMSVPDETNPWAFVWSLNGQRRDLVADQRYLIWKEASENSKEWQKEQQRIREQANAARSEKAAGNKNAAKDRKTEAAQPVQELSEPVAKKEAGDKTRQSKAEASNTNRGAVERGDRLAKDRPDLAEKVRLGEMKPAAAYRQMKADAVSSSVEPLPDDKYRVIYADPPWSYNDKCDDGGIQSGGAEWHYPSMSVSELCALPIKDLAMPDSVLFLWATSPLLPDGLKVAESWGFKYKTAFIWDKVKHNMGHYNSVRHEFLLVCTRGSCTPDEKKLFDSVQSIERTDKHSQKPEEFRDIINTLYTRGKKIELFRRGDAPEGWRVWGNEADG